jgi:hypothetical protein
MLGHASMSITLDVYSHLLPDMQEKVEKALEEALSQISASASEVYFKTRIPRSVSGTLAARTAYSSDNSPPSLDRRFL